MFNSLKDEFDYYFNNLNTNLCSFERDYEDVNNFYNFIQIGTRICNQEILVEQCYKKLKELRENNLCGTPDFGGIICVILYNETKDIDMNVNSYNVEEYLNNMDKNNPHCIRWAISLTYKLAELSLNNNINKAEELFIKCISYNFKKFNSLIVSKQMMACEKLARIYLDRGGDGAKNIIINGLELYKEALQFNLNKTIGENGTYIYFGCVELAELCDLASQLVKFLQNIDIYGTDRFEKIFNQKRWGLYKYCKKLEKEIGELKNNAN